MILDNGTADYMIKFVLMAVALVVSIILHELAHGYAALANGDKTAKYAGRLSPNPAKHFDLLGILMLLFVHVGYAKPVPVNPNNFRKRRWGFFTVSIAGVAVNFVLSFIFSFLYVLIGKAANPNVLLMGMGYFCYYMALYNLFLCFFNLLPLYPLDGYNLLETALSFKNPVVKFLRNYGMMILFGLFAVSMLVRSAGFPEWLDLLGLYLDNTAGFIYKSFIKLWQLILG